MRTESQNLMTQSAAELKVDVNMLQKARPAAQQLLSLIQGITADSSQVVVKDLGDSEEENCTDPPQDFDRGLVFHDLFPGFCFQDFARGVDLYWFPPPKDQTAKSATTAANKLHSSLEKKGMMDFKALLVDWAEKVNILFTFRKHVQNKSASVAAVEEITKVHEAVRDVGCGIPVGWIKTWVEKIHFTTATPNPADGKQETDDEMDARFENVFEIIYGGDNVGTVLDLTRFTKLEPDSAREIAAELQVSLLVSTMVRLGAQPAKKTKDSACCAFTKFASRLDVNCLLSSKAREQVGALKAILFVNDFVGSPACADKVDQLNDRIAEILQKSGKMPKSSPTKSPSSSTTSAASTAADSSEDTALGPFITVFTTQVPLSILNANTSWLQILRSDMKYDGESTALSQMLEANKEIVNYKMPAKIDSVSGFLDPLQNVVEHAQKVRDHMLKLPGDSASRHAAIIGKAKEHLLVLDAKLKPLLTLPASLVLVGRAMEHNGSSGEDHDDQHHWEKPGCSRGLPLRRRMPRLHLAAPRSQRYAGSRKSLSFLSLEPQLEP